MSDWPTTRRTLVLPALLQNNTGKTVCVAFFDADQTLRTSKSGKPSPEGALDTIVFEKCTDKLAELSRKNYILAIISNQAGIGLGRIKEEAVNSAMHRTIDYFASKGIFFNYYDFAEKYDANRKPNTGMAFLLEKKLNKASLYVDWNNSFMVGDAAYKHKVDLQPDGRPGRDHSNSDRLFAENIAKIYSGFKFYYSEDFFRTQTK